MVHYAVRNPLPLPSNDNLIQVIINNSIALAIVTSSSVKGEWLLVDAVLVPYPLVPLGPGVMADNNTEFTNSCIREGNVG